MKVLGVRTTTTHVFYCVLESRENGIHFLNQNSEVRIPLRVTPDLLDILIGSCFEELCRVLDLYPDIEVVALKENDIGFGKAATETMSKRLSANLDGAVLAASCHKRKKIMKKTYKELCISPKEAIAKAESHFGKTEKYWTKEMADAILVAVYAMEH